MSGDNRSVLDTNAVSEYMRTTDGRFGGSGWRLPATAVPLTTAITRMEVLAGVYALPDGRRRDLMLSAARRVFSGAHVLSFDSAAAEACAALSAARRRQGRPLHVNDGMIAAICVSRGLALVTRNVKDFGGLGLTLINPWEAGAT